MGITTNVAAKPRKSVSALAEHVFKLFHLGHANEVA